MRKNYKIFGIARSLYRIGSACANFIVGQALEPMSQQASNELDTENTQAYKNGIFGITASGNMPQSVQEDVISHLDCKYEDLIKNAGIFVPKTIFEDGETGYDKNAVVYTQNNDNTITFYVSQVDNNKSIDLTDTNYWVQEATIPGIIDGSKLTLNNLSDTAKENIKDIINLDSSDFSLLKTSLDDIIPTNNKELNGDTITSATIVVPERINYLKTKLTPAPNFTIVDGEPSVDLSGCYLISMAQRNLITSTYNGDCKYYTYIEGSDTLILPTVQDIINQLTENKADIDGSNMLLGNLSDTAKSNITSLVGLKKINEFGVSNGDTEIVITGIGSKETFIEFLNLSANTTPSNLDCYFGKSNNTYYTSNYKISIFSQTSGDKSNWITNSFTSKNNSAGTLTYNGGSSWTLQPYVSTRGRIKITRTTGRYIFFEGLIQLLTSSNGYLINFNFQNCLIQDNLYQDLDRIKFALNGSTFGSGVVKVYQEL